MKKHLPLFFGIFCILPLFADPPYPINGRFDKKGRYSLANEASKRESSIIADYPGFGKLYVMHIPDWENHNLHVQYLKRLSAASQKVSGCDFKNPAFFDVMDAEMLLQRVVLPMERLAEQEREAEPAQVLAVILYERGTDSAHYAFDDCFKYCTYMDTYAARAEVGRDVYYDTPFLKGYERFYVCQPNGITARAALTAFFRRLEETYVAGSRIDVLVMGHGISNTTGVRLSKRGNGPRENCFYTGEFKATASSGDSYAASFKRIMQAELDGGITPRVLFLAVTRTA